jgi:hypothetical protein
MDLFRRTPKETGKCEWCPSALRDEHNTDHNMSCVSPHFGDQCIACSNDKTTSGVLIDGPTLLHCQCDPKTGAAQANWPTAIFDVSTYHHMSLVLLVVLLQSCLLP